ncbi:glycosyltransferase [Castellaniella sp.]|uniref:glycosyltransferase n=1 Tax=Castellaniella sp. TaxID=1955812 RepID=UPI003A91B4BF
MKTIVVIPCFNDQKGLIDTLDSIDEGETLDVLIIDDGSDPHMSLEGYKIRFPGNIILHRNFENSGIEFSLNYGLRYALDHDYGYIARVDSGDYVVKNRFSLQKKYMIEHDLDLCGTWVDVINERGEHIFYLKHPVADRDIKIAIKKFNPFVHPSVMMTALFVRRNGEYPSEYPALEDWAYFMKARGFAKMGTVPQILTRYVVSPRSISSRKRKLQARSKIRLLIDNFDYDASSIFGVARSISIMFISREFLNKVKSIVWGR